MNGILMPDMSKRYTTCLLVGTQVSCYADNTGDYSVEASGSYTHRHLGTLITIGPFVIAKRVPVFCALENMKELNIVSRWNRALERAHENHNSRMVRRFFRGMTKITRPIMEMKRVVLTELTETKRHVSEQKVRLRQARAELIAQKGRTQLWAKAKYTDRRVALEVAKQEGIIDGYCMFTNQVTVIQFPSRKLALPPRWSRRNERGYAGGIYKFPAMHMTVLEKGSNCYMRDLGGNCYKHPHAGLGGDGKPCWDEITPIERSGGVLENCKNYEKADFLWYTSPKDYCLYIKGYLNSVWNHENGGNEYQPLQAYGELLEETEPAPTRSAVHDYQPTRGVWPIACGQDHDEPYACTCVCRQCSRSRNIYTTTYPTDYARWLEEQGQLPGPTSSGEDAQAQTIHNVAGIANPDILREVIENTIPIPTPPRPPHYHGTSFNETLSRVMAEEREEREEDSND